MYGTLSNLHLLVCSLYYALMKRFLLQSQSTMYNHASDEPISSHTCVSDLDSLLGMFSISSCIAVK